MEKREYLKKAETLENEGKLEEAINLLKECREEYPDFLIGRLYLANLLFKVDNIDEAEKEAELILKKSPNTLGALRLLGDIKIKKGNLLQAKDILLKVNFLDPFDDNVQKKIMEIEELIEKNIPQDTIKEEILPEEETPENIMLISQDKEPLYQEGDKNQKEILSSQEELAKEEFAKEEDSSSPIEEELFYTESMALVLIKQGEYEQAEEIYKKLSKNNPRIQEKIKLLKTIKKLNALINSLGGKHV